MSDSILSATIDLQIRQPLLHPYLSLVVERMNFACHLQINKRVCWKIIEEVAMIQNDRNPFWDFSRTICWKLSQGEREKNVHIFDYTDSFPTRFLP